jgi:PEP-CTERM motif
MKLITITRLTVAAVSLCAAVGAQAQLSDVGGFGQATYSSASQGYSPGRYMKWNGGATFQAYCIDPYTGTGFPGTYTQMTLDAFTNGTTGSGYAQQIARGGGYTGLSNSSTAQTQVRNDLKELFSWAYADAATTGNTAKAAAFGMAVWEIVMQNWGTGGNAYSRTAGSFTTTGGDTTSGNFGSTAALSTDKVEYWVNQYLSALNGSIAWTSVLGNPSATAKSWNYTVYFDGLSPFSQTFISVTPSGVPEPATAALVGLALLGVAAARRKSRA